MAAFTMRRESSQGSASRFIDFIAPPPRRQPGVRAAFEQSAEGESWTGGKPYRRNRERGLRVNGQRTPQPVGQQRRNEAPIPATSSRLGGIVSSVRELPGKVDRRRASA